MNLYTIRNRVLKALDESATSPQIVTTAFVDSCINEGYSDLILCTKILKFEFTLSIVANQYVYSIPRSTLSITRMYYETEDQIIYPCSWDQLQKKDHWWIDTTQTYPDRYIYVSTDKIFLYPRVTAAEASCITGQGCSAIAQDLSQDEDLPDMRKAFHDALVNFSLGMILLRRRNKALLKKAFEYLQDYEEQKASLASNTYNYTNRTVSVRNWP